MCIICTRISMISTTLYTVRLILQLYCVLIRDAKMQQKSNNAQWPGLGLGLGLGLGWGKSRTYLRIFTFICQILIYVYIYIRTLYAIHHVHVYTVYTSIRAYMNPCCVVCGITPINYVCTYAYIPINKSNQFQSLKFCSCCCGEQRHLNPSTVRSGAPTTSCGGTAALRHSGTAAQEH